MFIIIIMPKRTSKRKPRKVTKRKTKRKKRRRRRFGSSLVSDTTRTPMQAIMKMIRGDNPIAGTNPLIMRYAGGEQTAKDISNSAKLMKMIGSRADRKAVRIQGLIDKAGKLIKNSTTSPKEKKEIFHTVVVAVVSLLYQSIKDLSKKNEKYESKSKEVKRLNEIQQSQSYAALTAVSDDREYKELTDFIAATTSKGNVIGFTYKYENNDISVTMIVRYNTDEDSLVAKTFLDKYNEYYETEIMEQDGTQTITSTQTDNNETITTPNNTPQIVQQVDDLLADFSQMVIIPPPPEVDIMGEPLVDDTVSVVDDNLFDDVSNITITDDESKGNVDDQDVMSFTRFGRRKRKRKVSKKKGPSAALKKLCKRLKVKLTVKRGKKRVYKSEKVLKVQCKKASKKSSFGKKKKTVSKKKSPSAALKKLCKRLKVKLTTKRAGKRVYKSEKVLKAQCKKASKKSSFGKKKKRRKRTSK